MKKCKNIITALLCLFMFFSNISIATVKAEEGTPGDGIYWSEWSNTPSGFDGEVKRTEWKSYTLDYWKIADDSSADKKIINECVFSPTEKNPYATCYKATLYHEDTEYIVLRNGKWQSSSVSSFSGPKFLYVGHPNNEGHDEDWIEDYRIFEDKNDDGVIDSSEFYYVDSTVIGNIWNFKSPKESGSFAPAVPGSAFSYSSSMSDEEVGYAWHTGSCANDEFCISHYAGYGSDRNGLGIRSAYRKTNVVDLTPTNGSATIATPSTSENKRFYLQTVVGFGINAVTNYGYRLQLDGNSDYEYNEYNQWGANWEGKCQNTGNKTGSNISLDKWCYETNVGNKTGSLGQANLFEYYDVEANTTRTMEGFTGSHFLDIATRSSNGIGNDPINVKVTDLSVIQRNYYLDFSTNNSHKLTIEGIELNNADGIVVYYPVYYSSSSKYYYGDDAPTNSIEKKWEALTPQYSYPLTFEIKYDGNGATSGSMATQKLAISDTANLLENQYEQNIEVNYFLVMDPEIPYILEDYYFDTINNIIVTNITFDTFSWFNENKNYATITFKNNFLGWSRNKYADTPEFKPGETITAEKLNAKPSSTITLYAVWRKPEFPLIDLQWFYGADIEDSTYDWTFVKWMMNGEDIETSYYWKFDLTTFEIDPVLNGSNIFNLYAMWTDKNNPSIELIGYNPEQYIEENLMYTNKPIKVTYKVYDGASGIKKICIASSTGTCLATVENEEKTVSALDSYTDNKYNLLEPVKPNVTYKLGAVGLNENQKKYSSLLVRRNIPVEHTLSFEWPTIISDKGSVLYGADRLESSKDYQLCAIDAYNNKSCTSLYIDSYDSKPPVVASTETMPFTCDTTYKGCIPITAGDDYSGIAKITYSYTYTDEWGDLINSGDIVIDKPDVICIPKSGKVNVVAFAEDKAGNTSEINEICEVEVNNTYSPDYSLIDYEYVFNLYDEVIGEAEEVNANEFIKKLEENSNNLACKSALEYMQNYAKKLNSDLSTSSWKLKETAIKEFLKTHYYYAR